MTHDDLTMVRHTSTSMQTAYLMGIGLVLLKVAADLLAYPAVLSAEAPQALIYLLLLGLALLLYAWTASGYPRLEASSARIALRQGTRLGLLCGLAWVLELGIANLNLLDPAHDSLALLLYGSTTAVGLLLPALAAFLTARQTRQLRAGLVASLYCGTLGALLMFLAVSAMSTLLLQAGQHDAQTLREFQRSGLPDLTTFMVADYLAALIAHLWIGLITGLVGGVAGGLLGQIIARLPEAAPRTQR
jgi:hypothetical protein